MKEEDLYPDISNWLNLYLKEKYPGYSIETTYTTARVSLDSLLSSRNIILNEAVGLNIKIDIVGILRRGSQNKLAFIEVKNKELTLKDLGQLWGYTQLIDPVESFLISSSGLGALSKILKVLKREDLLKYGDNQEKMMKVAKWDLLKKSIDYDSLIPKI